MHAIQMVDDATMPDGLDFMFVQLDDGAMIFYRESAICAEVLEDSWAAYRALLDHHTRPPGHRCGDNVVPMRRAG